MTTNRRKSQPGNRMRIPAQLGNRAHFFYRTMPLSLNAQDIAALVDAVTTRVGKKLGSGVTQVSQSDLGVDRSKGLFNQIEQAMLTPMTIPHSFELLCCQWAGLHVDDQFFGEALYSTVIHTGPGPYSVETVTTKRYPYRSQGYQAPSNVRGLFKVGDSFVFDPTTPHMAVPQFPHQDSLLILAQTRLKDATALDRRAILKALPPVDGPEDEDSI